MTFHGESCNHLSTELEPASLKVAATPWFCIFATTVYFFAGTSTSFCYQLFLGLFEPVPIFVIFATIGVLVCWSELQFLLPLAFFIFWNNVQFA